MTLTVGSLFSGIGGLDLGLERAGMQVIWQSEIDPYACKVLSKHWPQVVNHGDIKRIQWGNVVRPDIICGGYPCQPFSLAGHRNGTDDPRHLWPWVLTAISELRPRYAILENVRGHLSLGGLSVVGDLASIGYDAEWRIVSAASVGANHRRDRIIIVAYPHHAGIGTSRCDLDGNGQATKQERQNITQFGTSGCSEDVAHSTCINGDGRKNDSGAKPARQWRGVQGETGTGSGNVAHTHGKQLGQRGFQNDAGQENRRWVYNRTGQTGYDGWQWWAVEPDVGRVADGIPARVDRLRGLGNAVVPQVAEVIGRMVVAHAESI